MKTKHRAIATMVVCITIMMIALSSCSTPKRTVNYSTQSDTVSCHKF